MFNSNSESWTQYRTVSVPACKGWLVNCPFLRSVAHKTLKHLSHSFKTPKKTKKSSNRPSPRHTHTHSLSLSLPLPPFRYFQWKKMWTHLLVVQSRNQEGMSISKQRQHFPKQFYVQCPIKTRGKKLQQDDDGFAPVMASSNQCWAGIRMEP
jgi:hypothetical protein